jgi:predicted nuclease with TOPRIM domain
MNNLLRRIDRTLVFERLISTFPEPQAEVLTEAISLAVEQVWGDVATKTDVDELKEALHRLAEAQARTDESVRALAKAQARTERRVEELAEAQARTERRVEELAEAQRRTERRVEELAEAQRRTEEEFQRYREASEARFARIEAALDRLAEAQARTEEEFRRYREASEARFARIEAALDRLAEAQARTEERVTRLEEAVARLAEAQARTERKVDRLARQVGGLSETIGGDLEDIAYIVLHKVLGRELGWKVGELKRVWQKWDGQLREVNIFGEAHDPQRPSQRIWIVGEAKHNLTMREVERFARTVEMARRNLEGEIFPVCFCYRARPEVQERIRELGFRLVFSYGELV